MDVEIIIEDHPKYGHPDINKYRGKIKIDSRKGSSGCYMTLWYDSEDEARRAAGDLALQIIKSLTKAIGDLV